MHIHKGIVTKKMKTWKIEPFNFSGFTSSHVLTSVEFTLLIYFFEADAVEIYIDGAYTEISK